MINGSIPGRALAALAVGAVLLAAGCGGGGGSPGVSRPAVHQELVAFAHCMRSHGVPGWPDPLPDGGFPRTGAGGNSGPQAKSAIDACQHLLPPKPVLSAAQQARELALELKEAKCIRRHGFPDFPDPTVQKGAGPFAFPPDFNPTSPQAQAAGRACHMPSRRGLPRVDRSSSMSITIGTHSLTLQGGGS